MEPYESIYVGQFIYMFGFLSGRRGISPSSDRIALLTQNRGDEEIGDLVASAKDRHFIIEFKRNEQSVETELKKRAKKSFLAFLKDKQAVQLLGQSRRGHFAAYGVASPTAGFRLLRYADIAEGPSQTASSLSLNQFFDGMQSPSWGWSRNEFVRYVRLLQLVNEEAKKDGTAMASLGVLVAKFDPRSRSFSFTVEDLLKIPSRTIQREPSGPELEPRQRRDIGIGR